MKLALGVVIGLGMIGGVTYILLGGNDYVAEQTNATSTVVAEQAVEEIDVIDAAKAGLEKINTDLDQEETNLLEERAAIDARLERIRETRTSF